MQEANLRNLLCIEIMSVRLFEPYFVSVNFTCLFKHVLYFRPAEFKHGFIDFRRTLKRITYFLVFLKSRP